MNLDDDAAQQKSAPAPGDDLYDLSVEEISERIALFQEEIERLRQIYTEKTAGMDAAQALFGKS